MTMPCLLMAVVLAAAVLVGSSPPQFRGTVHVVQLNATVHSGNEQINNLVAADFRVTDNGIAQRVLEVSRETMPIDLAIVFDTSRRSPGLRTLDSALSRVKRWLRPTDRMSLVTFNEGLHEHLTLVESGAVSLPVLDTPAGTAALNDAVAFVLGTKPVEGRRQLAVVLTNSPDTSSVLSEARVLSLARQSGVALFSVSPSRVDPSTNRVMPDLIADPSRSPLPFLTQVTSITGGVAQVLPDSDYSTYGPTLIRARSNVDVFTGPLMNALDEFRSSYVLSYSPESVAPGWHEVSVTVTRPRNNYAVRTRRGYLVE